MKPTDHYLDSGIKIHIRKWLPAIEIIDRFSFLLVHGLASNAHTWNDVAALLAQAGHPTAAIDQRGHGLSDKPYNGYDFKTITDDLHQVLELLGWQNTVLAGQSWGGNVLLEFGARFPDAAAGLIFVDGGFLNLKPRGSWDEVSRELRPPDLAGTSRSELAGMIKQHYPDWSKSGIEATLNNFETLPDNTVRPWLTLERHMQILKALYDQDVTDLYNQVRQPVLICAADDGSDWAAQKRRQVLKAEEGLANVQTVWFEGAAHDLHVDRPQDLVGKFLEFVKKLQG